MSKINPLVHTRKPEPETAAGLFPIPPARSQSVDAVCREHGVNRTVRVRADLETRVVVPLLKQSR